MSKALNFVRLDFITVKPYFTLKNLLIFLALPIVFIIDSSTSAAANGVLMVFAALYVSYPFAVGEKNGIDTLYPTLSIIRKSVVLGRYLFALTFDICSGIIAFVYQLVVMTILQKDFNASETLATILVLFVIFTVIQAIQLPIYFKLGYAKAKMLAYLPFFAVTFVVLAAKNIFGDGLISFLTAAIEWMAANPIVTAGIGITLWLGIMIVSCRTSLAFYQKRDF